jgi:hypothetical protein
MYREPYIRFPANDFELTNIQNRYAHLSNNSVVKHATNVVTKHTIEGNMWTLDQFQRHLHDFYGYDAWKEEDLTAKIK